jgi:hypothetical protein
MLLCKMICRMIWSYVIMQNDVPNDVRQILSWINWMLIYIYIYILYVRRISLNNWIKSHGSAWVLRYQHLTDKPRLPWTMGQNTKTQQNWPMAQKTQFVVLLREVDRHNRKLQSRWSTVAQKKNQPKHRGGTTSTQPLCIDRYITSSPPHGQGG